MAERKELLKARSAQSISQTKIGDVMVGQQRWMRRPASMALLVASLASLALAGTASAELTKEFVRFKDCPWKTAGVDRCVYSETTGGEAVLGSKTVPIVNPVILQGGYTEPMESGAEKGFAKFIAATNGVSLSKSPQPVPGGLVGLVPPASAPPLVKAALKLVLENGFTGVNTTLELAKPASDIRVNELNLALGEGVALKMPLRARLENPLLGNECYVGSSASPIIFELRTDTTSPPEPNKPIKGNGGTVNFLEEAEIIELADAVLVDNAWSAPSASGCGGILAPLIDPIINAQAGLPSAAGNNTAILETTIFETTAFSVDFNDKANP